MMGAVAKARAVGDVEVDSLSVREVKSYVVV